MTKFVIPIILLVLGLAILIGGCSRVGSSLNGSGKIIDQPIKITGFTTVSARGAFPVELYQSDQSSVTVSTDDNLIQRVLVALSGETLLISIQAPATFFPTSLKIVIGMPRIYGLILTEGAKASLSGFKSTYNFNLDMRGASTLSGYLEAGNLDFDISEGSQVNLKGSALDLGLQMDKAGKLDLSDYPLISASVQLQGASEATLDVQSRLTAKLEGASILYYLGNPTLTNTSISGASIMQPK